MQLPLLKMATMYFDKLVTLDPVGASWATIGADYPARQAIKQLKDAGILKTVTPANVLAKVPQDLQTDQTMRHLMGGFARRAAREAGDYREYLSDEPGLIQIQEAAWEGTEAI